MDFILYALIYIVAVQLLRFSDSLDLHDGSPFRPFPSLTWKMRKTLIGYKCSHSLLSYSLLSQIVQATVDYQLWRHQGSLLDFTLGDIPLLAWLLVSVSPLVVVVVNEMVKLHEIRYEPTRRKS